VRIWRDQGIGAPGLRYAGAVLLWLAQGMAATKRGDGRGTASPRLGRVIDSKMPTPKSPSGLPTDDFGKADGYLFSLFSRCSQRSANALHLAPDLPVAQTRLKLVTIWKGVSEPQS